MSIVKNIKFDLPIDGVKVRTIEEMREHFTSEIMTLYDNGLLLKWLKSRNYHEEIEQLELISKELPPSLLLKELCDIFKIDADDMIIAAILEKPTKKVEKNFSEIKEIQNIAKETQNTAETKNIAKEIQNTASSHYIIHNNGTVTDTKTNLMWKQDHESRTYKINDAINKFNRSFIKHDFFSKGSWFLALGFVVSVISSNIFVFALIVFLFWFGLVLLDSQGAFDVRSTYKYFVFKGLGLFILGFFVGVSYSFSVLILIFVLGVFWVLIKIYSRRFAGYNDWRVPTKEELHSLVDMSYSPSRINSIAFPFTPSDDFLASPAMSAFYAICFEKGLIVNIPPNTYNENREYYVRLVRRIK